MTASEREAVAELQREIDRERRVAECPCVRSLLVILSKGLARVAGTDDGDAPAREESRR